MCKCIERLLCLSMLATVIFSYFAFTGGGDRFRDIGEKTGGIIQKVTDKLADSADDLKKKKDTVKKKIDDWHGKKKEDTDRSLQNLKELKKDGIFEK